MLNSIMSLAPDKINVVELLGKTVIKKRNQLIIS